MRNSYWGLVALIGVICFYAFDPVWVAWLGAALTVLEMLSWPWLFIKLMQHMLGLDPDS